MNQKLNEKYRNKLAGILAVPYIFLVAGLLCFTGCKKLIMIPPPTGSITTTQVFSTDEQAKAAASGMYFNMINGLNKFTAYGMSMYAGMSADELIPFDQNGADGYELFYQNTLTSNSSLVNSVFWEQAYSIIYSANAIIENLKTSTGVHDDVKNELTGEAKFVRAFCNFYLVNLYGGVPLANTTNWEKTTSLPRNSIAEDYQSIISDLKDAQNLLGTDYSAGSGQRIIPNKWAATALLARVYLYQSNWSDAEIQSSAVIENSALYGIVPDLNNVFLANSLEAIWQLQQSNIVNVSYNATPEGGLLIPVDTTYSPFAYLTPQLLNAFETNDNRKNDWVSRVKYGGLFYNIPFKYKMGEAHAVANGPYTEYYMVLRLAEQYLIRAEAEAHGVGNGATGAVTDLNVIRNRAGLSDYTSGNRSLLDAIYHERQIELFAEWGNRWLDLKRTGQITTVLQPLKRFWKPTSQLFPIAVGELSTDPNLTQNPGY